MVLCHVCGGTDGARHAPNDLPRRLSGLRTDPSLARARPQSRARHHTVPDRSPGRPYPGVSGRPYVAHLVQLLSPPVVSPRRVSPDRALVGPPTSAAAGLLPLPRDLDAAPRAQSAVAGQRAGDDLVAVSDRAGHPLYLTGSPQVSGRAPRDHRGAAHAESDPAVASPSAWSRHGRWADPGRAVGGRAERLSVTGAGGDGRLSGEDGGRDPADLCTRGV